MPIQLAYTNPETDETAPVSHWVIDELIFIPRIFTSRIKLAGYFDSDAFADPNKRPFKYVEFDIVQEPLDTAITVGDALTGVYLYVIAVIPEFSAGTIV